MKSILLLCLTLCMTSCQQKNTEQSEQIDTTQIQSTAIEPIEQTPKVIFLKEKGLNQYAELSDSQFEELKKAYATGLFDKESLCKVFQKSLDITNSKGDINAYYKKFNKIPYFSTFISMYGYQLCTAKSLSSSSNSSYIQDEDANPCIMSEDFIKSDLRYPNSADFSMFDCSSENNSDGSYTILRKVSAKNGFGVESSYIYKVKLGFKGGNTVDINDWELISILSEEYK